MLVFEEQTCVGSMSANCCRIMTMTPHTVEFFCPVHYIKSHKGNLLPLFKKPARRMLQSFLLQRHTHQMGLSYRIDIIGNRV